MKYNFKNSILLLRKNLPQIRNLVLCLLLTAGMQISATAQNPSDKRITGKVISSAGEPLEGATIAVKNSTSTTTSDGEGNFSLSAPDNATLIITFVGYDKQEVTVAGKNSFTIVLVSSEKTLSDVVVVGYTSQKKSSLTGAISAVNMNDLESRRVPDVAQLLQGQVAGVQVTQSTGAPGDGINITIRGVGSIGSSSDPLFIVDGLPTTDISFINPADIQSMTVLKDASAAAIYGARASGGVVVIVTKSGQKGKSNINVGYYYGLQKVTNLPTMLNATQYMNKMEESWKNSGYSGTNPYTADKSRTDFSNTNWLKELFETGQTQNLQVSASGGSDKVQYLISGEYYGQDGIVKYNNDQYQRLSFRTNINANITDRLTVGTNLQISNTLQDKISSSGDAPGVIRHAFIRPPVIAVFKDKTDPSYKPDDPYTDLPFYSQNVAANGGSWNGGANKYEFSSNPLAIAKFTNDKRRNFKTFGSVYAEYGFLKNKELVLRSNLGLDLNMSHNKAFNKNYGDNDGGGAAVDKGTGRQNRPTNLNEDRGQETTITWTNTLKYNKRIQDHSFNVLVGTEYITNYSSSVGASRARFSNTNSAFQYIDFGAFPLDLWNGGGASEWALFSLFGSVDYNYHNRYFATASLRQDASSRFAENNQKALFPSFSAGWRISQENFMQNVNWISDLKLRASTGKLGNQSGLANYNSLAIYDPLGTLLRYGNPDLKWETTNQDNIGLDLGLFQNRLTISADYYNKTTSDLLLPLSLPQLVGDVQPTIVNAGQVSNKGFELSIGYRENRSAFKYSINANMSTVKNNVEKLDPNLPNIYGQVSKTEPGHPLNSFYGFKMTGIYQNQKEIDDYLTGAPHPEIKPGDIKFLDMNKDGVINDNDRTYIGNPNPRLFYGFNFLASYKNLDFAFLIQGVDGVEKYNDLKKIIDYDTRPFNHSINTLNAWNGEGSSNTVPRSTFNDNGSSRNSSIFVEDASYMRLKNIEIGYTINTSGKTQSIFQNARLYVSAQNLFTITNYTGLDPEAYNMFDQGTYPQSRAFLFGINIKL
ncbi:MAG: TonB-dependent receptor [Ginsengibacter sp.]|jgi:TonB-linked SusC/RagA family outer membrane protein